ncbi:hypothetical protein [Lactiplantibacillus plantarum]
MANRALNQIRIQVMKT